MRLWYSKDFEGHWPVGACAIVIANYEVEAEQLMHNALEEAGLNPEAGFSLVEVDLTERQAIVLLDGEY